MEYELSPEKLHELDNRYSYHAPKSVVSQPERYEAVRSECRKVAEIIVRFTPPSREQSTALTYLDQVMFNANAAIARHE